MSVKEGELISLRRQLILSEKSKNESDRKDHVIEGMQQTFVMVLNRAQARISGCLSEQHHTNRSV